MTATIIEPSDEFKRRFDEAADKAAREVSALMKEKPLVHPGLSRREAKRLAKAQRKLDMKRKKRK